MRKKVDCRDYPSEMNCTSSSPARRRKWSAPPASTPSPSHGHTDSPELREQIRAALKDEIPQHP